MSRVNRFHRRNLRSPSRVSKQGRSPSRSLSRISRIENNRNVATIRSFPFPQKMRTQLVLQETNGIFSTLTAVNSKIYQPSSYFDIDPVIGGPSFGGFGTYAAMYGRYRVIAFKYTFQVLNLENFGVMISTQAIASSALPTSGTAFDACEVAVENEYGKYQLLAPKGSGGDGKTLTGYVKVRQLWGTPECLTDNDWAGSSTTSPTVNSYIRFGAKMINGTPLTNGVQYIARFKSYGYFDQIISKTS